MAGGLFELRRDAITGWWVATVVDRQFQRGRFSLAAAHVDDAGDCQNCTQPPGDGIRLRILKDYAFHVVGAQDEARELEKSLSPALKRRKRSNLSIEKLLFPAPGDSLRRRQFRALKVAVIVGLICAAVLALLFYAVTSGKWGFRYHN
jgi:hypothetical protein